METGIWNIMVHRFAKSRTQLKRLNTALSIYYEPRVITETLNKFSLLSLTPPGERRDYCLHFSKGGS